MFKNSLLRLFRIHGSLRIAGALALILLVTPPVSAGDGQNLTQTLEVPGLACQGANYFNGGTLSDYANTADFLPPAAFDFWSNLAVPEVGVHVPGGLDGVPVTADTPPESSMATFLIPGLPQEFFDQQPERFNVPIHEAHLWHGLSPLFAPDGGPEDNRIQLPLADSAVHKFTQVRNGLSREPITLEQWNRATGSVELGCYNDGTGFVRVRARNLVPNTPYTAWQVFAVTDPPDSAFPASGPFLAFGPLGGAPNALVSNARGRARYERQLSYCPIETENPLMYIALFIHWDYALYGASAEGSFLADITLGANGELEFGAEGYPAGLIGSDHLCFPTGNHLLEAVEVDDDDSDSNSD